MRKGGPGVSQVRRVKIVPPVLEDKEVTGVGGRVLKVQEILPGARFPKKEKAPV